MDVAASLEAEGVVVSGLFLRKAERLNTRLTLGLLISIVTKSQLVANQLAVLITYLPSLLLSNFVFPVVNMPKALQLLTSIVPATYYIDILNGIYLKNLTLTQMWPSYLVLTGMFLLLATLNFIALKREGL